MKDFVSIRNVSQIFGPSLTTGDKIASINNNRPEWNILNYAVSQIGAILCPMYPTISASDYVYIFNHSEVKYVFDRRFKTS